MSFISLRSPGILPILSSNLARKVERMASTDPDTRDIQHNYPIRPTAIERAEAATALPAYEAALRPISDAALIAWAEPINAAVRNPQSREDFLIRVSVWAHALRDVPVRCFTPESQSEAMRAFQFWPAAADVYALLKPQADALIAAAKALQTLAETETPPPPPPSPTAQEVAAVAAKLRGLRSELSAEPTSLIAAPEHPQARHLPREMLNRAYAAAGITGPKVPQ